MKPKILANALFCVVILDVAVVSEGILDKNTKQNSNGFSRIHATGRKHGIIKGNDGVHSPNWTSEKLHLAAGSVLR